MVFSFVSRRIQPLQHRQHPSFKYEGIEDATRMSPEPKAESEVIRRCCKHCRVLEVNIFYLLTNFLLLLKKNYKSWYCMPPTSVDAASDGSKKRKATPGSLLQRKIHCLDAGQ